MSSISCLTPSGNPIYQRGPGNFVTIKVGGTYTGTPDYIQYQVENLSAGVIQAFASLNDAVLEGGRWSGTFTLPASGSFIGQWLQFRFQFHNSTGTQAVSNAAAIGDILLLTGQSNAQRFAGGTSGSASLSYPASMYFIDGVDAANVTSNLVTTSVWATLTGWKPDAPIALANAISALTGMAVGFIYLPQGGTALNKDGASSGTPTQYLLSREGGPQNYFAEAMFTRGLMGIKDATLSETTSTDHCGIFHIHGEQDAAVGTLADSYMKSLSAYYNGFRALTVRRPADYPMFITPVGKYAAAVTTTTREAQLQWCLQMEAGIIAGDHYDLTIDDTDGLGVHLNLASLVSLAKRVGMDVNRFMTGSGVPGAGPFIQSGYRSGNTIVSTINLNGHSGVTAQNGASPLTGFSASNNGFTSSISPTNVTLSGTTLTQTYSSLSSPPYQFKYGVTVYGTSDNLVVTTDDATGDTNPLPLQTTACAINVADPTPPALPAAMPSGS